MPTIRPGWELGDDELQWQFSRSGGPGGQHVNTSDTRASVSVDLTASPSLAAAPPALRARALARLPAVVVVTASDSRSQWRNREAALARLVERLREATAPPPPPRRPTRPTRGSVERRLEEKRRAGERKRLRRPDPGE